MNDLPLLSQIEYDTLKRERDTAVKQLQEIGATVGCDMGNFKKVTSQWKDMGSCWKCKNCGKTAPKHVTAKTNGEVAVANPDIFCSSCGAKMNGVEEVPRCNRCGKELDMYDLQENYGFEYHCGYGSRHDLEKVKARFCCDCFDDFLDDLILKGKISPIVSAYEV